MKKAEFIRLLTSALKERNISDVDEIVSEYRVFFDLKLADGHSEEEIAARLGDPKTISEQFDAESPRPAAGNKGFVIVGLAFADLFVFLFFILLYAWILVMAAGAVGSFMLGAFLILNLNLNSLLPEMPDLIRVIFGAVALELAVLLALATGYFGMFVRQLQRSYLRFHKNRLASAKGEGVLPSLPIYPQIPAAAKRRLRTITLIMLMVFVVSTLSGYIAAVLAAGNLEFWHVWGWFGYP